MCDLVVHGAADDACAATVVLVVVDRVVMLGAGAVREVVAVALPFAVRPPVVLP